MLVVPDHVVQVALPGFSRTSTLMMTRKARESQHSVDDDDNDRLHEMLNHFGRYNLCFFIFYNLLTLQLPS